MKQFINGVEVTQEQYEAVISASNVWNKQSHIAEINEYHNQQFEQLLQQAGYLGAWEVAVASTNTELEYQAEAQSIMNYLWDGEQIINNYALTVTEANAKTPEQVLSI